MSREKDIRIHPHYNDRTMEHDIAILKLPEPLPIMGRNSENTWDVDYACLPEIGQVVPEVTKCWAAGWGSKTYTESSPYDLREVNLDMFSDETCLNKLTSRTFFGDSMICAGDMKGKL